MNPEGKRLAERVLVRLCKGGEIVGVRFGYPTRLLVSMPDNEPSVQGQLTVGIDSPCRLLPSMPPDWPENPAGLEQPDDDRMLEIVARLRHKKISDIRLADAKPHLIISFDSGEVLFIHGSHCNHEPWEVAVFYDPAKWLVVATPNDGVAVWAPPDLIS